VIGYVEGNSRLHLMDVWATGYLAPAVDRQQNVADKEGLVEDGVVTIKFSR